MAQLYEQVEGNDKGKLAEIIGESDDILTLVNIKSKFEYRISLRDFWKGFKEYNANG